MTLGTGLILLVGGLLLLIAMMAVGVNIRGRNMKMLKHSVKHYQISLLCFSYFLLVFIMEHS